VAYQIKIAPAAERQLKKLPEQVVSQIIPVLKLLADEPRPAGAKKLKGADDIWRVRTGDYRILYTVEDRNLTILVLKIDHRKQVYRGM
jgi:mRNA interferase RelE/StbE